MNDARIVSLFASLDHAVEILAEKRTSDSICVAAFDTLKQARALAAQAFAVPPDRLRTPAPELADLVSTR